MIKEIYEDDSDLFQDVIGILMEKLPEELAVLQKAVELQQNEEVRQTAHRIRSSLISSAASESAVLAGQLEDSAAAGDIAAYTGTFPGFKFEIDRLITYCVNHDYDSYFE